MEEWARTWLKEQRQKGEKCIEIKEIQGKPYVYRSTSIYDRTTRSPKKVSTYLGRLTKEHGLIPKGTRGAGTPIQPRNVYEHGNAALIAEELGELIPALREAFPTCWQEIVALTFTRTAVYTPLARVGDTWGKLDNVLRITPDCDPGALSRVLTAIGSDHAAQQAVFRHLSTQAHQLVYDLSFVFSRSDIFNLSEFSNNTDNTWLRQITIALSIEVDTRLPTMFRVLPGTVGDAATLIASLTESDTARTTLVLDRRAVSEANETLLREKAIPFVVLQRRNNARYATRIHLTDHFFYHKRLIRAGKREINGLKLYLYEDADLKIEEKKTLYRLLEVGHIERETLNQHLKRAGRIMLLSSIVADPQEVYELYKSRNTVEDHFDALKSLILADRPYLQDATAIFGHIFIGFLCSYLYCRIQNRIEQAGLSAHLTPEGLLLKLSKVYAMDSGDEKRITEVPEHIQGIAGRLHIDIS
jgi:transposase